MLQEFLSNRLYRYADDRNKVENPATSGLSPWFHFGHISTVEVVNQILQTSGWDPESIQMPRKGSREGWWNLDRAVASFLDQIITWRELGFNNAYHLPEHNKFESLPDWAKTTLMEHASDERVQYTFEQIEEIVRQELEERCWKDYEPTPGVEPYAPGSCQLDDDLEEQELEEGGQCTGPTQKASSTSKGKKWMQCVKNPDGKGYKRIHWGQKGVRVTGDSGNTKRKKSFRARHGCSDAKAGTAKYMACKDW